jgi:hypothetical protein
MNLRTRVLKNNQDQEQIEVILFRTVSESISIVATDSDCIRHQIVDARSLP